MGPAVNTDYAKASTTEPTFTVLIVDHAEQPERPQGAPTSIGDESVAPETPVGKSNMDKFDEYLK